MSQPTIPRRRVTAALEGRRKARAGGSYSPTRTEAAPLSTNAVCVVALLAVIICYTVYMHYNPSDGPIMLTVLGAIISIMSYAIGHKHGTTKLLQVLQPKK